jgi:hypothetical protein
MLARFQRASPVAVRIPCCCSRRASERAEAVRLLRVPGEHLAHDGRLGFLDAHAGGIARTVRVDPVAEGRPRPRQHQPRLQLALSTAAHALGDQRALVLRDRAPDLQQQLVVWVAAHGTVQEPHGTAMSLQLLQQQDLMDVVARQPVRRGDHDQVERAGGRTVAQAVETRTPQGGAAAAVIAEDAIGGHVPALLPRVVRQALQLLLDRLGLRLAPRRHARVEPHPHDRSPARRDRVMRRQVRRPGPPSRPAAPGRPGPSGVGLPGSAASSDARSTGIASVPPVRRASAEAALARVDLSRSDRRDKLSRRRVRRTRQNLSFAILITRLTHPRR